MKKIKYFFIFAIIVVVAGFIFVRCDENYKQGKKYGTINKLAREGQWRKTLEGHLQTTQTGMNSGEGFDFSVDYSNEDKQLIAQLDSAAQHRWIVEIDYHEVLGYNWLNHRGSTNVFVTGCKVQQRQTINNSPGQSFVNVKGVPDTTGTYKTIERVIDHGIGYSDTIYVIILDANRKPVDFSSLNKPQEEVAK